MPHVSKRLLEKEKFLNIHKQFYKITESLVRNGKTKLIFDELLTKTEKLMLAKRLAIIAMLENGESTYSVENILKVSSSTVLRMSKIHKTGKYDNLLKEVRSHKSFWHQICKIIPPRVGRGRFNNFLKF